MGEMVMIGDAGDLPAYLAVPSTPGPWPGVVVLHEIFGLDDAIRAHADRMAAMGYLALAPDLMAWGSRMQCIVAAFRSLRTGTGRAFDDIARSRQWLLDDPRCAGDVGVIGFCLGGGFALAILGEGYAVAAPNYGQLPRDLERLEGACPVVASYGGRDMSLPRAAKKLKTELDARGIPNDVKEYAQAGHSFHNPSPANLGWWTVPVSRLLMRVGSDPVAAQDSWARIEEFFGQYLPTGSPEDRGLPGGQAPS